MIPFEKNGIIITQNGNEYLMQLESSGVLGYVRMPPDRMFIHDAEALDTITKALAIRWGLRASTKSTQRKSNK
jgi:hypothetical protein